MQRKIFFLYGVGSHAMFLAVYAWMAAFVGDFGFGFVPTIDGPRTGSLLAAVLVNSLLIAVFGVQHSVMARPTFKRWWMRFVPQPIERSTYVLISNFLMILLMLQWRPMGGIVWDVTQPQLRWALHGLFALGWLAVPAVSLLINHFDLFGTRQVWLHLRGQPYTHLPLRAPMAYRYVRHPLYVGWMTAFWATPTMSAAHLLFALLMTAYIFIAIPMEERNLVAHFGAEYARYRQRVGRLVPKLTYRGHTVTFRARRERCDVIGMHRSNIRHDLSAFRDVAWWSWVVMVGLLVMRFATGQRTYVWVAAGLCGVLAALDAGRRRGDVRAMSVQIRLGFVVLLLCGLLPQMVWLHAVLLAGTMVRILTGYCLLHRKLLMLPWNLGEPLTATIIGRILFAAPGAGGLWRFSDAQRPCAMGTVTGPSSAD